MAGKDPRKLSAFESGMRGSEKPKVAAAHGKTMVNDGEQGGESKQKPGGKIGDPGGVDLSAYTSGMRGTEKPKQKSADEATDATGGDTDPGIGGGVRRQGPNTVVGKPKGHSDAAAGKRAGVDSSHIQQTAKDAKDMGIPGNNTEAAAEGDEPYAEEDDTHINVRIPKSSLKKKAGGLQGN